jgi:hypothetical protein
MISTLFNLTHKIALFVAAIVSVAVAANVGVKAATFNNLDRTLLAEYRVLGRDRVPLVIAAQPSRTAEVARTLESLGGEIVSRLDEIGYLYVKVKLVTADRLEKIAGIDAMEVACAPIRGWAEMHAFEDPPAARKIAPPSPFLLIDNPYTAEYVTQASEFKKANPTFDGRGVVIGFPEAADPSMPSMKGALDLNGLPLPKFHSYWWGQPGKERPAIAAKRANFRQKTEAVTPDKEGFVTFAGRKFKMPQGVIAREWRICTRGLSTPKQPADIGEIVLWAVDKHQLWILLEGKNDFHLAVSFMADPMKPFQVVRDDDPKRDESNRFRAWVFVVDEDTRTIAFGRVSTHAQMVASLMAGNSFMGSGAGGIAPASQLASFMETGASDEEFTWMAIQSVFAAFKDPRVDIVQSSMLVGDTGKGRDPRVVAMLLGRLVQLTTKPLSVAVGNAGPALTGIFGMAPTFEGFSVGGYTPTETWMANMGFQPSGETTLAAYSAWGPAADGSLKPDFLALTQTLCERTVSAAPAFEKPFGFHTVSGGTSAAAPHAAGHLALLISAAKQKGIKHDWLRLRAAIATTARFLPGIEARAQGHGLIQISDAWEALQRANGWEPPGIDSTAMVIGRENTAAGRKPGPGRGLFEASGWTPGMSGVREITVIRTKGPAAGKLYQLRWKDNRGAFSSALTQIILPLGKAVKIPVSIKVGDGDSYSAVLDLIDPEAQLVVHSVLATVFVSRSLNQANGYTVNLKRPFERPGNSAVFIDVPAGLSQLKMRFRRADGLDDLPKSGIDQFQLIAEDPTGRRLPYFLGGSVVGEGRESAPVKGERIQVYPNPLPGVWHFFYQFRGPQTPPTDPQLKRTELTWEFTGYSVTSTSDTIRRSITFTNQSALELKAKVSALGLGSQRESEPTLTPGLTATLFDVEVPEGSKRLEIELLNDDANSVVGLYVYRAPEGPDKTFGEPPGGINATAMVYYNSSGQQRKQWIVESPKPGKYVVAIDPIKVPAAGLTVHYRDLIIHPAYGEITCSDSEGTMAPGATRSVAVDWTIGAQPFGNRTLVLVAALTSSEFGYSKLAGTRGTPSEKLEIVSVPLATHILHIPPTGNATRNANRRSDTTTTVQGGTR